MPFPELKLRGIKIGNMITAMGEKIFKHMLRYRRKKYASIPAFRRTSGSSWILKTVKSHLNGLLEGG